MVPMRTFWLQEKNVCYERHNFSKSIFSKLFMFFVVVVVVVVGAVIMKVECNKSCVSIKTTTKIYFLLLWQLRFYLRIK